MKLSELLAYDNIVIQCHDNPDADTIACGFGVYLYLKSKGKEPRLIYGGQNVIRKNESGDADPGSENTNRACGLSAQTRVIGDGGLPVPFRKFCSV